jgi:hypothetical protein
LELRRRLDGLLKRIGPAYTPPEKLRQSRAIQALELIGSTEAQLLLGALAKGTEGARQSREARQALDRLARGMSQ